MRRGSVNYQLASDINRSSYVFLESAYRCSACGGSNNERYRNPHSSLSRKTAHAWSVWAWFSIICSLHASLVSHLRICYHVQYLWEWNVVILYIFRLLPKERTSCVSICAVRSKECCLGSGMYAASFLVRQPQECEQKSHIYWLHSVLESRNRGLEINIDLVI